MTRHLSEIFILKQKLILSLGCASALFNTSCISQRLNERLDRHANEQQQSSQNLKKQVFKKKAAPLDWIAANKLLFDNNVQYKNSLFQISETKRARKQQWQRHLPRIFANIRLDTAIENIAKISSENISFNLSSSFDFPNPISYYTEAYGLALQEVRATTNHKLQSRRLTISLYQAFLQAQSMEERLTKLQNDQKALQITATDTLATKIRSLKSQQRQIKLSQERQRLALNRLFNTPGKNWKLVGPLPKVNYAHQLDQLDFYKDYGALGLKLQATEIEGSILSLWQVKLSRWPTINLDLNAPQYSISDTQNNLVFNSQDYQLFTGLSKSIQLNDAFDKRRMKNANFRFKQTREALVSRVETETSQLEVNKFTYRQLLKKKEKLRQAVQLAKSDYALSNTQTLLQQVQSLKTLHQQLDNLENQITQLDLQFWLWDDSAWPSN